MNQTKQNIKPRPHNPKKHPEDRRHGEVKTVRGFPKLTTHKWTGYRWKKATK